MKNKAFTLIEIIAALVILVVIALIAIPIVTTIIEKSEKKSDRISVENYAHAIELALAQYELETGDYPNTLDNLKINYTGSKVQCNIKRIRSNGEIFLSECYVDGNKVEDKSTYDKYYHYGKSDYDLVDEYGKELEKLTIGYVNEKGEIPTDISVFETNYDNDISCDTTVNTDGTIFLNACKINNDYIKDESTGDNYYHYGAPMLVKHILERVNSLTVTSYSDGNISEMYTFEHPETDQTPELTDYRYIGTNPNNYVKFNDELWRIIGVFTVEDENGNFEQKVKIMKNKKLNSNLAWDSNNLNEWSTATLNTYLNGNYYNSLSTDAKSMISNTKYYLGGITSSVGADKTYINERGTNVYSGRSINWVGKIGLIYPSDYIYTYALGVDDICYERIWLQVCYYSSIPSNGWLYNVNGNEGQWTISPDNRENIAARISSGGIWLDGNSFVKYSRSIYPSLYLVYNVKFDSGDGTEHNPYKLKL